MAAVTLYGSAVSTTDNADQAVSVTTVTGDLVVIALFAQNCTSFASVTITDTQGGTYAQIPGATALRAAGVSVAAFFVRNQLVASGGAGCVITADFVTNSVLHTGGGIAAFKATGMTKAGLTAIRQSAKQDNGAAAATPTPVLGAAALTTNALIGFVFNGTNPATMTARASWTESLDTGFATPTTGFETMNRDSGETASSIAWGGTSATTFGAGVIELDTTASFVRSFGVIF